MAQSVSIDTLKASETLQAAGLDATSAKAVVGVISEAIATTAATKHDLEKTETRLTQNINTEIAELRAEMNIGFATLDNKIDVQFATLDNKIDVQFATLDKKIAVQGAELRGEIATVRGEISDSVNRMTRNVAGLIGLALGLAALWSVFGPVASKVLSL